MKVLKTINDSDGFGVQIQDGEINVWIDVWENDNNEFVADWNMYIFSVGNSIDDDIKAYQENNNNFDKCSSLTLEAVEIYLQKKKSKIIL
jgi:hypothetical protein